MRISSLTQALFAGAISVAAAVSVAAPHATPVADKAIPKIAKPAPKAVPIREDVAREERRGPVSNGVNQDAGVPSAGSEQRQV